jgi:hypothetical protein
MIRLGHEQEDWDALPVGSYYMDPLGQRRRKSAESRKKLERHHAPPMVPGTMEMDTADALMSDPKSHLYEMDEISYAGLKSRGKWEGHAEQVRAGTIGSKVEADTGGWGKWAVKHIPGASLVAEPIDKMLLHAAEQRIQRGDATGTSMWSLAS